LVEVAGPADADGRPDPDATGTAAEFVDALRRLKNWAGVGYRRLESRAAARGVALPRSTVTAALSRLTLPREDLVAALVLTCGGDDRDVTRWLAARRRLAAGRPLPTTPSDDPEPARCTLPADPAVFVGRERELAQITAAVADAAKGGGVILIHAIDGMPGIGKTSLAVHVAHRLAGQFNDRQLFVDLHAYTPGRPPLLAGDALAELLTADGVDSRFLPSTVDGRAALWRSRMAGQRMLLVLDDAASTEQVLPLLPGTPDCLVLVTSRRGLGDLPAAVPMPLDVLSSAEASTMFMRLAPSATAFPQVVGEVVHACGYLPLAISITASLFRRHPSWSIGDLLREVRNSTGGLIMLTAETRTVAAVFDLSYQHLAPELQRCFRLLGLQPGADIDPYAAAALTGLSLPTAQRYLDELHRFHLLDEPAYRRYRMHDLIRAHAQSLATAVDHASTRQGAIGRLLDFYQHTTATAMATVYPCEQQRRPTARSGDKSTPDLSDWYQADLWLDRELPNLLAAARYAAEHGQPEFTWQMSVTLNRHLRTRGRYHDAQTLHQQALDTARQQGNVLSEMDALIDLGNVHRALGHHEKAHDHCGRALRIAQDTGDQMGELHALNGLGHISWILGNYEQALENYQRARWISRQSNDRSGELNALNGLGHIHVILGHHEQALDHYGQARRLAQDIGDDGGKLQALTGLGVIRWRLGQNDQALVHYGQARKIARDTGNRAGELYALHGLGHVHWMLGNLKEAGDHHERAVRIAQETGDRVGELQALNGLGHIHLAQGRHDQAANCYRQTLERARELGSANWQFEALQSLGRLHHAAGQTELALTCHEQALQFATDLTQLSDQARAHDGIAHAHRTLGDPEQARKHWQQALDILTCLGADHTDEVQTSIPNIRAHLAGLPA
jgi:tetratricopeptide (TPR) repeat protein